MKLSLEWLSEFVSVGASPKVYADAMTLSGSKVEAIEEHGAEIVNVVAGRVIAIERHADADKLYVCAVDTGGDAPIQIVTGAPNVHTDDLVPVALDGAKLPDGREIRAGVIRGVTSNGMLCSLGELNLAKDDFPYADPDGIFILEERAEPGQDIRDVLGLRGHTVEFEITNNRPDCLSVIGLARESAATFGKPLTLRVPHVKGGGGPIESLLSVRVEDPDLCPRYSAGLARNVKIGPSPRWLRERLRASGVRPINNIVDITNYVMLEYGQPMHAFDYARLDGRTIAARRAVPGEALETLDGQPRALSADMLVIADARRPVAVAGVMGGADSEITESARDIVFESANFHGPSVHRTSLALGLRTESSNRFEKGLDPCNTMPALARACELVEMLGAGVVCDGFIDVSFVNPSERTLPVDAGRINALLGTKLPAEDMFALLAPLGFERRGDAVAVPSWRADVEGMADLSEEIARLYGYNRILSADLPGSARGGLTEKQCAESLTREICRALGYSEILTYSFIGASWYDKLGWPEDDPRRASVIIENPLGEETSLMRATALPSLLHSLASNEAARNPTARLYEMAMTYRPGEQPLPDERPILMLGGYGDMDFFTLKGAVATLLNALRVENIRFETAGDISYHPGRCARLLVGDVTLGLLGEIHPDVTRAFDGAQRYYAAELDFMALLTARAPEKTYQPLPRFPTVNRDLAVVCDDHVPAAALETAIRRGAGPLLVDCRLFDVYTGSQVAQGRKSVAFALELRAPDRTLTDREADDALGAALSELRESCGAVLR